MSVVNTFSTKKDTVNAVEEIKDKFSGHENKLILFFASSLYPKNKLAEETDINKYVDLIFFNG